MLRTLLFFGLWMLLTVLPNAVGAVEGPDGLPPLSLREALFRGLEENFDLLAERVNLPIGREDVTVEEARFDPLADAVLSMEGERTPTASVSYVGPYARRRELLAGVGLGKVFETGLAARLALESSRLQSNADAARLDPEYRSFLVLDLRQPLLRDGGSEVTTTDLRLADQRLLQARFDYLDQAQRLVEEIELAYFELARSHEILRLRVESRELARELLLGNNAKFEAGIVPVTEVQEAETAVAARDEQVVFARQQMETAAHRLKDLLEITYNDPRASGPLLTEPLPGTDQVRPDLETALALALDSRPDLEGQRLEIAGRDIRLAYQRNQRLPRLDLEATFGVNGLSGEADGSGTTAARRRSGDYWRSLDEAAQGDGYEWYAGLRLEYPLGNRAAEARYRRAGHEKRQALYRLKGLETTVETEVRNALTAVERGLERVRVAERFQGLADVTLSQEMERLGEGLSDTFRVLDFQAAIIEARLRKVNALVDFNQGLAGLYRAMGANLERHGILPLSEDKELTHERN